jgi:hypothetical protein
MYWLNWPNSNSATQQLRPPVDYWASYKISQQTRAQFRMGLQPDDVPPRVVRNFSPATTKAESAEISSTDPAFCRMTLPGFEPEFVP